MYDAIVIGVSIGGMSALSKIIPAFPKKFSMPVIIIQLRVCDDNDFLVTHLDGLSEIHVTATERGEAIKPKHIYINL